MAHLVRPEVDGASGHHLRQLESGDEHGHVARHLVVHGSEGVVRVHERVDGEVHRDEPPGRGRVLGESVPAVCKTRVKITARHARRNELNHQE